MTKYELEQFLKEKHSKKEIMQVLKTLSDDGSRAYESAMEKEDVYAIGFSSATHLAYESAIKLLEVLE